MIWQCSYCGLEKTGSVTRVKDHLACVPNKDINICENVPADVRAGLEVWRRQRFGISVHEGGGSHDVEEDVSVCEASQIGASMECICICDRSKCKKNAVATSQRILGKCKHSSTLSKTGNARCY